MKRFLLIFFGLCMICNVYAGDIESKEKSDINYDNKEGLNMAITVNLVTQVLVEMLVPLRKR